MNPLDRDQLVGEIHRLQKLLDQVQDHLSALAGSADEAERSRDVLTRACVDEAYAELELAKRIPSADAWQAIRKATAAVGRLADAEPEEARSRAYLREQLLERFMRAGLAVEQGSEVGSAPLRGTESAGALTAGRPKGDKD